MDLTSLKGQYNYCMHGLGAIGGLRQTNTLEAFNRWYKRGVRVFEFDIARTEDDRYVAVAHTVDEKSMFRMEITEKPQEYTYDWYMGQKLFPKSTKGLTPLSLESIIQLLVKHNDCVFMLDLFGMFTEDKTKHFLNAIDTVVGIEEVRYNAPQRRDTKVKM